MLSRLADRIALRILLRRSRSVDEMLYLIKRICMVILDRTQSERSMIVANNIMDELSILVRNRRSRNGRAGGGEK